LLRSYLVSSERARDRSSYSVPDFLSITIDFIETVFLFCRAEWWTHAANQGYAKAQHSLGCLYFNGLGVPANEPMATHWFQVAAAQGHSEAVVALSDMEAERQRRGAFERKQREVIVEEQRKANHRGAQQQRGASKGKGAAAAGYAAAAAAVAAGEATRRRGGARGQERGRGGGAIRGARIGVPSEQPQQSGRNAPPSDLTTTMAALQLLSGEADAVLSPSQRLSAEKMALRSPHRSADRRRGGGGSGGSSTFLSPGGRSS
jgi:hypothetical protein